MLLFVFRISKRKQNATVVFMVFHPGEECKFLLRRRETISGITDILIQKSCEYFLFLLRPLCAASTCNSVTSMMVMFILLHCSIKLSAYVLL